MPPTPTARATACQDDLGDVAVAAAGPQGVGLRPGSPMSVVEEGGDVRRRPGRSTRNQMPDDEAGQRHDRADGHQEAAPADGLLFVELGGSARSRAHLLERRASLARSKARGAPLARRAPGRSLIGRYCGRPARVDGLQHLVGVLAVGRQPVDDAGPERPGPDGRHDVRRVEARRPSRWPASSAATSRLVVAVVPLGRRRLVRGDRAPGVDPALDASRRREVLRECADLGRSWVTMKASPAPSAGVPMASIDGREVEEADVLADDVLGVAAPGP